MAKPKRRLTRSEALDRICRRELGKSFLRCSTGGIDVQDVLTALENLRSAIGIPPTEALHLLGEKEENDTDDAIARMAETGLLHPAQFMPEASRSGLRATIGVAITEYQLMPLAPYRLRNIPDKLQGHALGLAALVLHALRH
jgi:hypothetical protein